MRSGLRRRSFWLTASVRRAVSSIVSPASNPRRPPLVVPAWKQKMSGCASATTRQLSSSSKARPIVTMPISCATLSMSISFCRVMPALVSTR